MASEIDICNLALALLGDDATVASIDPPEGSPQATHCARFYPMARAMLQSMHEWSFCTRRDALAQLTRVPSYGWQVAYAMPPKLARVIEVVGEQGEPLLDYAVETLDDGLPVLYANAQGVLIRYTQFVTDPARFPAAFTDALTWLLASMLAGPLLKGDAGAVAAKRCLDYFYTAKLPHARGVDVAQQRGKPAHVAPWMAQR